MSTPGHIEDRAGIPGSINLILAEHSISSEEPKQPVNLLTFHKLDKRIETGISRGQLPNYRINVAFRGQYL